MNTENRNKSQGFGIAHTCMSAVIRCTPELLNRTLDSRAIAETATQLQLALERRNKGEITQDEYDNIKGNLKKKLPIITPHAYFPSGNRKNDDAVPSGMSIIDVDHHPDVMALWESIKPRSQELGLAMAHITPSAEGLRLIFAIPEGMNIATAQAWMAQQIGVKEYDVCTKDMARCSFLVPRSYVLYLDEAELFKEREVHLTPNSTTKEVATTHTPEHLEEYPDLPYPDLLEELESQLGGAPSHGSRNNFIFTMACQLRYVCNDDPNWVAQVLPTYGESRDKWMATIRSACSRNHTQNKPSVLRRALENCKRRQQLETALEEEGGNLPPAMPKKLPPLIKHLISKTPDIYKPAVAHAVFPALGAHLWQTRFKYIDNVEHEATLMNVLMAGTGAGKSCIDEPIRRIMRDIDERDAESTLREKEWKQEIRTKAANKEKPHRPKDIIIQRIATNITNAALVQRWAEADGRFLYTKMNEIEQFDALKTSVNSRAQFEIMCLAFDPGAVYGQDRVGAESVCERVTPRFNWNATTTVKKGKQYFSQVLTDGPISRINFCTIPEREIGAQMPVYGEYNDAFDEELRPYIERLNNARGMIECPQARTLARKLVEECQDIARLSQNRVYENLSFRGVVIAYLKAMVLYVAQGEKWDKRIEDFVRWSLQYDLWCKMHFFGEAIEKAESMTYASTRKLPGTQNMLAFLPMTFTLRDAAELREQQGKNAADTRNQLKNWKARGYITEERQPDGKSLYRKTEEYLAKHEATSSAEPLNPETFET